MIVFQQIVRSKELINVDCHKLFTLHNEARRVCCMHLSRKQKHWGVYTDTNTHTLLIQNTEKKKEKLALPAVVGPDLFVVTLALDCHEYHSDKEDASDGAQSNNENQG